LHGEGRLGDGARFGGAPEVLLAGEGIEIPELLERHMRWHKKL